MRLLVPPPIQAAICGGLMWLVAEFVPEFTYVFPGQTYIVAFFVTCGVAIDLVSIRAFSRKKTTISPVSPENTSSLIIDGIYRYSRNPMYLGLALILTGFGVWLENLVCLSLVPGFVWYISKYQIEPEEEVLLEKFEGEYADYIQRVGRWI